MGVKFSEKLAKLTEERDKRKLSLEAGLPPTAVSNYISKANIPRSDTALKLARILNVPVEWFIDDSDDRWPAPSPQKTALGVIPDLELMGEVCRRYWLALKRWEATIVAAEHMDWDQAMKLTEHGLVDRPLTVGVLRLFQMVDDLRQVVMFSGLQFNIDAMLRNTWQQYTDDAADFERVNSERLRERANKVLCTAGALAIYDRLAAQLDELMAKASASSRGVPFLLTHARRPQKSDQ